MAASILIASSCWTSNPCGVRPSSGKHHPDALSFLSRIRNKKDYPEHSEIPNKMEIAFETRKTTLELWIPHKCEQELRDNILVSIFGPQQFLCDRFVFIPNRTVFMSFHHGLATWLPLWVSVRPAIGEILSRTFEWAQWHTRNAFLPQSSPETSLKRIEAWFI